MMDFTLDNPNEERILPTKNEPLVLPKKEPSQFLFLNNELLNHQNNTFQPAKRADPIKSESNIITITPDIKTQPLIIQPQYIVNHEIVRPAKQGLAKIAQSPPQKKFKTAISPQPEIFQPTIVQKIDQVQINPNIIQRQILISDKNVAPLIVQNGDRRIAPMVLPSQPTVMYTTGPTIKSEFTVLICSYMFYLYRSLI